MRHSRSLTLLIALCLMMSVLLSVCLIGCSSFLTNTPKDHSSPQKPTSYVSIDINPSIDLVLDQNGIVMSVSGANHDGRVLLFDEDGIVGTSLDVAVGNILSLAAKYSYISADSNAIAISAVTDRDKDALLEDVRDSIQKSISKCSRSIDIVTDADMVLEQELASIKAAYPDNEQIQAMDASFLRLAKLVWQPGEELADVCSQALDELLAKANRVQTDTLAKFDSDYTVAVEQAQYMFDSACSILKNSVYIGFYLQDIPSNISNITDSISYTMASASRLALQFFDACLSISLLNEEYCISEAQLQDIADELGVGYDDFAYSTHAAKTNDSYTIGKDDLSSYINTLFRNADEQAASGIKQAYISISAALKDSIASVADFDYIKQSITSTILDYIPLSDSSSILSSMLIDRLEALLETLVGNYIPDDINLKSHEALSDAIADLDEVLAELEEDAFIGLEDNEEFVEYQAQLGINERLSELRRQLSIQLDRLKDDTTSRLVQEKASRLS